MPSLIESQQALAQALLNPEHSDITGLLNADSKTGLGVYQYNYQQGLIQTLANNFPYCKNIITQLISAAEFERQCLLYIQQQPSKNWDINLFGHQFSSSIKSNLKPLNKNNTALFSLIADIDYALLKAYYCSTEKNNLAKLANVKDEQQGQLVFQLRADLHFYQSRWQLEQILQQLDLNAAIALSDHYQAKEQAFIIERRNFHAQLHCINSGMATFLQQCQTKQTLAQISQLENAASILAQLPIAIEKKWIQSFKVIEHD